jgi:hypothetical protein
VPDTASCDTPSTAPRLRAEPRQLPLFGIEPHACLDHRLHRLKLIVGGGLISSLPLLPPCG